MKMFAPCYFNCESFVDMLMVALTWRTPNTLERYQACLSLYKFFFTFSNDDYFVDDEHKPQHKVRVSVGKYAHGVRGPFQDLLPPE